MTQCSVCMWRSCRVRSFLGSFAAASGRLLSHLCIAAVRFCLPHAYSMTGLHDTVLSMLWRSCRERSSIGSWAAPLHRLLSHLGIAAVRFCLPCAYSTTGLHDTVLSMHVAQLPREELYWLVCGGFWPLAVSLVHCCCSLLLATRIQHDRSS